MCETSCTLCKQPLQLGCLLNSSHSCSSSHAPSSNRVQHSTCFQRVFASSVCMCCCMLAAAYWLALQLAQTAAAPSLPACARAQSLPACYSWCAAVHCLLAYVAFATDLMLVCAHALPCLEIACTLPLRTYSQQPPHACALLEHALQQQRRAALLAATRRQLPLVPQCLRAAVREVLLQNEAPCAARWAAAALMVLREMRSARLLASQLAQASPDI